MHVLVRTKNAMLNDEIARVCGTWQFKPPSIAEARVPMGFGWTREPKTGVSKWVY